MRIQVVALVWIAGCSGRVTEGDPAVSSTVTGGAGGATTTSVTGAGGSGTTGTTGGTGGAAGSTTGSTGISGCEGAVCGKFCEACEAGCLPGHCDGAGTCVPESFSESPDCPPADQVNSGAACAPESSFCPSDQSCSGYLQCRCGLWTLINPC